MSDRSDIDLVRDRADILQVLAPYVALKRSGRVWKGLCPFHNEKTPSFTVDPDRKTWYCFGQCGEGGDAIKFLQKIENLSFPEALERLALQVGVVLTPFRPSGGRRSAGDTASDTGERRASERERLYAAVECAARFYQEALARSSQARAYLADRAIGDDALREFRLGYSGEDWDALPQYLAKNGVALADAVSAGLLAISDKGGHYDKLRGRVIFPILDVQERVIGFGGRLMEAVEGRPKYLNSAETPLFVKGRTLYGLWRARKAIAAKEQAIVVEGYMDVIAAHQARVENVVAALGTSLTEGHAQLLGRYARRVLLSFDADAAGLKAADRAAHIFAAQEMEALMLDLPAGEDPDSLIRAGRVGDFVRAVENALPVPEHHLRKILAQAGLATATDEVKLAVFHREVLPILRRTKGVIERERYINMYAPYHPYFNIGERYAEERIRQDVEKGLAPLSLPLSNAIFKGVRSAREHPDGWKNRKLHNRIGQQPIDTSKQLPQFEAKNAEKILLMALLGTNDELISEIVNCVQPGDFLIPIHKALVERRYAEIKEPNSHQFDSGFEVDLDAEAAKIFLEGNVKPAPIDIQIVRDSIAKIRLRAQKQRIVELRHRAIEGDEVATIELLKLQQERRRL